MASLGNSTKLIKAEIILIILKLFQKTKEEGTVPVILWSLHHSETKARQKHYKKRKLQANISEEYRHRNSQQNINKLNPTKIMYHSQAGFILGTRIVLGTRIQRSVWYTTSTKEKTKTTWSPQSMKKGI